MHYEKMIKTLKAQANSENVKGMATYYPLTSGAIQEKLRLKERAS